MKRKITLKRDTEMSTGYRGRGIPSRMIVVPAGTVVDYAVMITKTGTYHTVYAVKDGIGYEASKKETLLYPPTVWCSNHESHGHGCGKAQGDGMCEVPYDLYIDAVQNKKVGDKTFATAGGPGVGHVIHQITRIDKTGVYAIEIENTIRELTIEEVM